MQIEITHTENGNYLADDKETHVDWLEATPGLALAGVLTYTALDESLPYDEDDEDGRYTLLRSLVDSTMSALRGHITEASA